MKNKSKVRFRIGAMCLIALFLLIPLLSSPVAAAFIDNTNVTTNNPATGAPTVVINPTTARVYIHASGTPTTASFTLTYSFTDSKPGGSGSNHYADITVTPPGVPAGFASVGPMFVPAGTGPITGILLVGPLNYGAPPPPTTWTVTVTAFCTDIASTTTTTAAATFLVTVQ
jgi:hypothetical protein